MGKKNALDLKHKKTVLPLMCFFCIGNVWKFILNSQTNIQNEKRFLFCVFVLIPILHLQSIMFFNVQIFSHFPV